MRNGTGIFFLSTCRPRVCSGISEDAQLRRCRADRWLGGDSMRPSKAPDQVDMRTLVWGQAGQCVPRESGPHAAREKALGAADRTFVEPISNTRVESLVHQHTRSTQAERTSDIDFR